VDFSGRREWLVALVKIRGIDEASRFVLKRASPTMDMAEDVNSWLLSFDHIEQFPASQMCFLGSRLIENS
jgi:hypothetical protein